MIIKLLKSIYSYFLCKHRHGVLKKKSIEILSNSVLSQLEKIDFEGSCYIGPGAVWNPAGGVIIKNNVIIGPNSFLMTVNHNYKSNYFLPYDKEIISKKVIIEENVWIGGNVTIVPGVKIGEGAVIGAGSVVYKDVPPLSIIGSPFTIIGYRDKELYYKLKSEKKFYLNYKYNGKI